MDQKVKHHETKDLDVYFAQLLGMAVRTKKKDRAKGLKMVLGDGFIDCFFFTLFAWGRWLTKSLRPICSNSTLICLKTFLFHFGKAYF